MTCILSDQGFHRLWARRAGFSPCLLSEPWVSLIRKHPCLEDPRSLLCLGLSFPIC